MGHHKWFFLFSRNYSLMHYCYVTEVCAEVSEGPGFTWRLRHALGTAGEEQYLYISWLFFFFWRHLLNLVEHILTKSFKFIWPFFFPLDFEAGRANLIWPHSTVQRTWTWTIKLGQKIWRQFLVGDPLFYSHLLHQKSQEKQEISHSTCGGCGCYLNLSSENHNNVRGECQERCWTWVWYSFLPEESWERDGVLTAHWDNTRVSLLPMTVCQLVEAGVLLRSLSRSGRPPEAQMSLCEVVDLGEHPTWVVAQTARVKMWGCGFMLWFEWH